MYYYSIVKSEKPAFATNNVYRFFYIHISVKNVNPSSIYTHINTLKKKDLENIVEKGEIAKKLAISPFSTTGASLNLGRSQNGVLRNGLSWVTDQGIPIALRKL